MPRRTIDLPTMYQVPIYIAEIMPNNIRGGFISANSVIFFPEFRAWFESSPNPYMLLYCNSAADDMLWLFTIFFCWNCGFMAHVGCDRYLLCIILTD